MMIYLDEIVSKIPELSDEVLDHYVEVQKNVILVCSDEFMRGIEMMLYARLVAEQTQRATESKARTFVET